MSLLRRRRFRKALRLARDARALRESSDPFSQLRLACEIQGAALDIPAHAVRVRGVSHSQSVASIHQRLVSLVGYRWLLPALVTHMARPSEHLVIPLPNEWRSAASSLGVPIARGRSRAAWALVVIAMFAKGLQAGARLGWLSLSGRLPEAPRDYTTVVDVTVSNLPVRPGESGHDLVSWYRDFTIRRGGIVWAHIPGARAGMRGDVVTAPHYFPRLDGALAHLRYSGALALAAIAALGGMLAGRWWKAALLEQSADLMYARALPEESLARSYLFNNSAFVLRPLWTYWAEDRGAEIHLVFYATNIEPFPLGAPPRAEWPGYRWMTWPRYVVWDDAQARFLRALGHGERDIVVAGSVGFSDGLQDPGVEFPSPFAVVFDVTPQHPVRLALRGIPQPYYTPEIATRFMADVSELLHERGMYMVQKRKRRLGQNTAPRYRSFIDALEREPHVRSAAPEVAPQRLIEAAVCVVSMPFTSTALIAAAMGKPSVFYDPTGLLGADEELAHGVRVIGSRERLANWLDELRASTELSNAGDSNSIAHRN